MNKPPRIVIEILSENRLVSYEWRFRGIDLTSYSVKKRSRPDGIVWDVLAHIVASDYTTGLLPNVPSDVKNQLLDRLAKERSVVC